MSNDTGETRFAEELEIKSQVKPETKLEPKRQTKPEIKTEIEEERPGEEKEEEEEDSDNDRYDFPSSNPAKDKNKDKEAKPYTVKPNKHTPRPISPSNPLQNIDPRFPRHPPTKPEIDQRKLLSLYLCIQLENPDTHSTNSITRAKAVIHNLRTLMTQVSASGVMYDHRAMLRLRSGEWGDAIFAAREVLREEGVEIPVWEGGEYEDFLGVDGVRWE